MLAGERVRRSVRATAIALLESTVRELEAGHDVADRPRDPVHTGAQIFVDDHESTIEGHTCLFETEIGREEDRDRRATRR